ncbi:hypothetical protein AAG747_02000 [Rapidithrix thailandica]|uniref:Uncharacterized protein n=1 Tax=Rapidithrix thailandica TaxID=413964 RepID=A0AAW9S0E5_9BACT
MKFVTFKTKGGLPSLLQKILIVAMTAFLYLDTQAQDTWVNDNFKVTLQEGTLSIAADDKKLLEVTGITIDVSSLESMEFESMSSSQLTLKVGLDGVSTGTQNVAELKITKVKNGIRLSSNPEWAKNFSVKVQGEKDHFYTANAIDLPDENAFYISSSGYGYLFKSKPNFSGFTNTPLELSLNSKELDWYIFYGPDMSKIHEGYYSVVNKL